MSSVSKGENTHISLYFKMLISHLKDESYTVVSPLNSAFKVHQTPKYFLCKVHACICLKCIAHFFLIFRT